MGWYIIPEMFFIEHESEKWWLFHIKFIVAFASNLKVYFIRILKDTALPLMVASKYQHLCICQ